MGSNDKDKFDNMDEFDNLNDDEIDSIIDDEFPCDDEESDECDEECTCRECQEFEITGDLLDLLKRKVGDSGSNLGLFKLDMQAEKENAWDNVLTYTRCSKDKSDQMKILDRIKQLCEHMIDVISMTERLEENGVLNVVTPCHFMLNEIHAEKIALFNILAEIFNEELNNKD